MTAAAQRRTPLELVPGAAAPPDDNGWLTEPVEDQDQDWRAKSVIDQWTPEHQLIGALMWLTAEQARPILELVPDTAIWRPITEWAYEIIRAVVADGRDPNPVLVLSTAGQRPWSLDGAFETTPPTPARHHQLALHLASAYTQVLSPASAAGDYAREVLDEAYRRAIRDNGIRMQQLADCGAARGALTDQFAQIRDELADLWRRAETAAKPGWWRP